MSADTRPIEVGDRFEDKDYRNKGRVVQVRSVDIDRPQPDGFHQYEVQVEAHPNNPQHVGRYSDVGEKTLRTRYRRISR